MVAFVEKNSVSLSLSHRSQNLSGEREREVYHEREIYHPEQTDGCCRRELNNRIFGPISYYIFFIAVTFLSLSLRPPLF